MNHLTASWAVLAARTYFHATHAVLEPGDVIVPGSEIGQQNHPMSQPGKVYLAETAAYAGSWWGYVGDLAKPWHIYEVSASDAQHQTDQEWTASRAVVVREVSHAEADPTGEWIPTP